MTDILKDLNLDVHCDRCGEFTVAADVISESQHMLERGCPGSPYECPAQLFATLVDKSALESLAKAWQDVQKSALCHDGRALLIGPPHLDLSLEPEAGVDCSEEKNKS